MFKINLSEIPRLRQYFVYDPNLKKDVLVREKDARKVSWTELFYDLIYVVVIDHLGMIRFIFKCTACNLILIYFYSSFCKRASREIAYFCVAFCFDLACLVCHNYV
jgi:hypothetical protein